MNCKWCSTELSKPQVYDFLRGKSKGTSCSKKCSMMLLHWESKDNFIKENTHKCVVCEKKFVKHQKGNLPKVCSLKCSGVLSSKRMKVNNPMFEQQNIDKVRKKLIEKNHRPIIQGGNGRGATIYQLQLYNELSKYNDSFEMELIEKTKPYTDKFKSPYHYKIDVASRLYKIAIEIDGLSHNTKKVKECDKRKEQLLNLKGWKVLRLSNLAIKNELQNCVQVVLSMI